MRNLPFKIWFTLADKSMIVPVPRNSPWMLYVRRKAIVHTIKRGLLCLVTMIIQLSCLCRAFEVPSLFARGMFALFCAEVCKRLWMNFVPKIIIKVTE